MSWLPASGQTWIGAAASFLGMWTLMMTAMMLPSLIPMLSRYRQSVGRAGAFASVLVTVPAAAGYLLIWALLGAAVYPLGVAITAATMRHLAVARATPIAIGLVVLTAGAIHRLAPRNAARTSLQSVLRRPHRSPPRQRDHGCPGDGWREHGWQRNST